MVERVFTTAEVAEMLRLSVFTVQRACLRGEFPGAFRTGDTRGHWRIPLSALTGYHEGRIRRTFSSSPEYGVAPYRASDRQHKKSIPTGRGR